MEIFTTITGTESELRQQLRKLTYEFKCVEPVEFVYASENYQVKVLKLTPYTPEEQQERMMYGDPDFEEYLMSEDYEADVKAEQWDWLKNEMS
jgi:hypothetical protein